jgi:hypothetical protein
MRKLSSFLFFTSLLMFSCSNDEGPVAPDDDDDDLISGTETVSYSKDVQPLFNRSCISCHNDFHILNLKDCCSYEILTKNNYVNVNDPEDSQLYKRIKHPNPTMPPNGDPLSEQEVEVILTWIKEGAKDN